VLRLTVLLLQKIIRDFFCIFVGGSIADKYRINLITNTLETISYKLKSRANFLRFFWRFQRLAMRGLTEQAKALKKKKKH